MKLGETLQDESLAEGELNATPLVSVLMTAYNRENYIAEAIESVLASDYLNFELIIVDDRSSDKTVDIIRSYQQRDSRIRFFVNDTNLGDYPNRNQAVSKASGEYLFFVDSDDQVFVNGISLLIKTMRKYPGASFGMYYFLPDCIEPVMLDGKEAIQQHFFKKPFLVIGPGATILKKSFLDKIGGYPVAYGAANDMFFNLKACCYSPVVLLPFTFMKYRIHDGQEQNNRYGYIYNNYLYMKAAIAELPLGLRDEQQKWLLKKNKRRFLVNACKYFFKTGNVSKTNDLFKITNFSYQDVFQAIFQR
jgi:glycosyltransferase involved in cell wall biosynthesis